MGSHNFYSEGKGKDMSTAYRKLCEYNLDYYGHQEGYNGTISTTNGFIDKTSYYLELSKKKGMTRKKSLYQLQDESLEKTEKWGRCWGVKLKNGHYGFMGWAAS